MYVLLYECCIRTSCLQPCFAAVLSLIPGKFAGGRVFPAGMLVLLFKPATDCFFAAGCTNLYIMNTILKIILAFFAINICLASGYTKTNDGKEEQLAPLSVEFDNIAGDQNLVLNTGRYVNAANEEFSVSMLQYYISNIKLKKVDGSEYIVPQDSSYFLIRESDPSTRFAKLKVPEGTYTSLSFILGVDSLRATMDLSRRKGVLDIAGGMEDGMYWGWTMGYIFFKLEGSSPAAPLDPLGIRKFRYHIGGFGNTEPNPLNNIKTIQIDLTAGGIAKVRQGGKTNIHLMVDIGKLFNGNSKISIASHPSIMFSTISRQVSDNFSSMFRHDHTENQ
jgi:hypothetical protein